MHIDFYVRHPVLSRELPAAQFSDCSHFYLEMASSIWIKQLPLQGGSEPLPNCKAPKALISALLTDWVSILNRLQSLAQNLGFPHSQAVQVSEDLIFHRNYSYTRKLPHYSGKQSLKTHLKTCNSLSYSSRSNIYMESYITFFGFPA